MEDKRYTNVVYKVAKMYLKEGWYSREELRNILILSESREAKIRTMLQKSMEVIPDGEPMP